MEKRIPFSSQTVGPYFTIGLEYLIDRMAEIDVEGAIEIRGRVLDRDGAPVPDAMLEFWSACEARVDTGGFQEHGIPDGLRRVATDPEGSFAVRIVEPEREPAGGWESSGAAHAGNGICTRPAEAVDYPGVSGGQDRK